MQYNKFYSLNFICYSFIPLQSTSTHPTKMYRQFWRSIRRMQSAFNFRIPNFRFLGAIRNHHSASSGTRQATTAIQAINWLLSALPSRWPLPIPFISAGILTLLTVLTNTWVAYDIAIDLGRNNEIFTLDPKCRSSSYDYIVVGGGAAGMVVATRVANASRNIRVLLLEAGGEPSILNDLPAAGMGLMYQRANTWSYLTVPQKHSCFSCKDGVITTTRGKMLGGSTSINFMMYVRGNKEDFNQWAVDANDEQWNYENVLPYFKKSEDYNGHYTNEPNSGKYHGKGGLLNVGIYNPMPGAKDFLNAALELGYKVGDYNGDDQLVFSKNDATVQDGWRESVYRAFYQDTGKPPNLCIKKYAHVTKIHFDQLREKPKAVAVTYHRHDITRTVTATKEVILSAGAFGTPKLLMLSGIGPANDLTSLGIPVIKDLPVGQNLQDHVSTLVGPFFKGPSVNLNRDITIRSSADLILNGEGIAASPSGIYGNAFMQSPVAQPPYPDLQIFHASITLYPEIPQHVNLFLGINADFLAQWFNPYHKNYTDARFILLLGGRPKSVGYLKLSGKNPNDKLIIDPKYLSHPDDTEMLLYGFKKTLELFENTKSLSTPLFSKPMPGCENFVFKSDDYIRCAIKFTSSSFYHHVGTCALGQVVDSKLKVKGIDGLRVIDASVIPRTPNGNTQAPTIMIGEKGADLIIQDLLVI